MTWLSLDTSPSMDRLWSATKFLVCANAGWLIDCRVKLVLRAAKAVRLLMDLIRDMTKKMAERIYLLLK